MKTTIKKSLAQYIKSIFTVLLLTILLTSCSKDTELIPLPPPPNDLCGVIVEGSYGWSEERSTGGYTYTLKTNSGALIVSWSQEFLGVRGAEGCMVLGDNNIYVFVPSDNQL